MSTTVAEIRARSTIRFHPSKRPAAEPHVRVAYVSLSTALSRDGKPVAPDPSASGSWLAPAAALCLVVAGVIAVALITTRWATPDHAHAVESFIAVDGQASPPADMFLTTVGVFANDPFGDGRLLMAASKRDARAVAGRCLGLSTASARRIRIRSGDIEGPSAGLMFALGIIDRFEHGNVSRRHRIAGTGTISPNGTVGPVAGVPAKVTAAERVGAELFLVPASQVDEAEIAAVSVRVVGVKTLDEALRAIAGRGCVGQTQRGDRT